MSTPLLVSTDWLTAHLNDPNVRVADVRWYLFDKDKTGRGEYERGHILGAVYLDIDTDLADHAASDPGRHPLPRAEAFAESMARAGIGANTHVVAYDDRGGATAARLWWLLRYFGHDKVSLLDGGIAQWIAGGRPLQTEIPSVPRAEFVAHPHPEMVVDKTQVGKLAASPNASAFDVRVPERYRGDIEPIDPRAGHVPGAINAPIAGNLRSDTDARFRRPEEIRARFEKLGAKENQPVVAYCGSGINASQTVFALALAGFKHPLLYEGSWSDWSRDKNLPAAVGSNPK